MKRGLWKKLTALSLAAVLSMGLAACGRDEGGLGESGAVGSIGNGNAGNGSNSSVSSAATQPGKENVYSFQELQLLDSDDNVSSMVYLDGKLYLLVYNWVGSGEESNRGNVFGFYQTNLDGSDSRFVELALPESNGSYNWVTNTLITEAGYIYAVENNSYEDASDPNNYIYENRYFLHCWNIEGSLQWSRRIDGETQDWFYCSQLLDGGEGRVLALTSSDKSEAVLYSPQGEELSRRELDRKIFDNSGLIYTGENGTLMVMFYNEEYTKCYLAAYNLESGALGERVELPFDSSYSIRGESGTTLLLTNSMGLYTWSAGDAEPKMLMDMVNSGLPANEFSFVQLVDDCHFVAMYSELERWTPSCAYFTYVNPADIPDKEELVLGGMYIGSDIRARVIAFNRASDRYRITLKDYNVYNTNEDWTAGQIRLNSDIISGQMPDILISYDMKNYVSYASKGALADVGALLDADPELGGLEYLQNVREAYSVGGRLYAVVPSFSVRTMMAKKSWVGEPASWTMADMEMVLDAMPQGAEAFGNMTQGGFSYLIMNFALRDYMDVETGKCNFNSQGFIELLEYAKTLPRERDQEYGEDYDYFYEENRYRDNRALLYDLYITNIGGSKHQIRGYMGEEVSFVGFPAESGGGSYLSSGGYSLMISAKSRQQEGAWQFVRQYLTPEYQSSESLYNMPVLKSAFETRAQEATERSYWIDENGSKQYYDDCWNVNGESILIEPFTQEEVDKMCAFICSVNRTSYYDDYIYNIIVQEAEAFFVGQKNVQEVVDIIQSRVQIYVDENR